MTAFVDKADERFRLFFTGPNCKLESSPGVFTTLVSGVSWPAGSPLEDDEEDVRKDVREEAHRIKSVDCIVGITTACKVRWRGTSETVGIEDAMRKERRLGRVGTDGRLLTDTESDRSQRTVLCVVEVMRSA